jgi:glycosyltransferase 2 family protein
MDKEKIINLLKNIAKVAIVALSLYLVSTKVSLEDIREVAFNSNPVFLLLAFLSFFSSIVLSAWRLNSFFRGIDIRLPQAYNFKLYLLGMFYNLFLPSGIGGDGYKVYFLKKKFQVKTRRLISCLFFDRLSGLWALLLITALLIAFIPQFGIPNWLPILLVLLGSIAYTLIMKRFFRPYATQWVLKHIKAAGVQSLQIVCVICILFALNFEGKFSPYLLLYLISQIVAIIPISPGGLGTRELFFMFGADYMDLDPHRAVLISLLSYFISALISLLGSYLVFHPESLGEKHLPDPKEMKGKELEEETIKTL